MEFNCFPQEIVERICPDCNIAEPYDFDHPFSSTERFKVKQIKEIKIHTRRNEIEPIRITGGAIFVCCKCGGVAATRVCFKTPE